MVQKVKNNQSESKLIEVESEKVNDYLENELNVVKREDKNKMEEYKENTKEIIKRVYNREIKDIEKEVEKDLATLAPKGKKLRIDLKKAENEDFNRFNLQHCRIDEIKFFSLARNYNRVMEDEEPYLKEYIPGFEKEIDIKVFSVPDGMNDKVINEKLKITRNKFKSDMKEIFITYLTMKYEEDIVEFHLIPENMVKELHEFYVKLEILSQREAFYSRDLSSIIYKLKMFETMKALKEGYPLNKLKETIDYLLEYPYSIEKGYSQLVTHVDKKFFHEYDENNKQGAEKYIDNPENEYDKLTSSKKTAISDVINLSLLNLSKIKYSYEKAFNCQPLDWERAREKSLKTAENIQNYYSNQVIINREHVREIVRPKIFLSLNGEVGKTNDKEDVFYIDKDNKIKKAKYSEQKYYKDTKDIEKKEYILPDEPEKAYIASNEEYKSSTSSLPSNQKFIAKDKNGEYSFVETDNTGKITDDKDIANKKLYTCQQVGVEYAEMIIPENIKENKKIPDDKKRDVYIYKDGLVQSRAEDSKLKFKFKNDDSNYEGMTNMTVPSNLNNKLQDTEIKNNKNKNINGKSGKYLNKVHNKVRKIIGKGKGKTPEK